jgi:hypothetical protein
MKFANHFANSTMFPLDFNPGTVNATAYAAKLPDGATLIALINKDATQSLLVQIPSQASEWDGYTAPFLGSDKVIHAAAPEMKKTSASIQPHSMLLLKTHSLA